MQIGIDACCWSNRRGFGRFTRELLNAVVAVPQDNSYVFFADRETAAQGGFPPGVEVVAADTKVAPTEAASGTGRRSAADLWALTREVKRHDLDLFFFPAVYSYFPILNRTKIIVTIHDMIADHHPDSVFPDAKLKLFWKIKQRVALRQSDLILTVSEHSKAQILDYFGLPSSRVAAISEGPSHVFGPLPRDETRRHILQRCGIGEAQRFVLYVGGISPHKNLKTLIEAYKQLIEDPKFADVKLVLVGDYQGDAFHSDYPALKNQVEASQLEEQVIFTGFVPDDELAHLYNAAAVFVLPSLEEGFGLPIVEAMACGTPVIGSDRGSIPEILGEGGLLFDPLRTETLLLALQQVLGDESLAQEMKRKGLARSKLFTWEAVALHTLAIFAQVAQGKNQAP